MSILMKIIVLLNLLYQDDLSITFVLYAKYWILHFINGEPSPEYSYTIARTTY